MAKEAGGLGEAAEERASAAAVVVEMARVAETGAGMGMVGKAVMVAEGTGLPAWATVARGWCVAAVEGASLLRPQGSNTGREKERREPVLMLQSSSFYLRCNEKHSGHSLQINSTGAKM